MSKTIPIHAVIVASANIEMHVQGETVEFHISTPTLSIEHSVVGEDPAPYSAPKVIGLATGALVQELARRFEEHLASTGGRVEGAGPLFISKGTDTKQ